MTKLTTAGQVEAAIAELRKLNPNYLAEAKAQVLKILRDEPGHSAESAMVEACRRTREEWRYFNCGLVEKFNEPAATTTTKGTDDGDGDDGGEEADGDDVHRGGVRATAS